MNCIAFGQSLVWMGRSSPCRASAHPAEVVPVLLLLLGALVAAPALPQFGVRRPNKPHRPLKPSDRAGLVSGESTKRTSCQDFINGQQQVSTHSDFRYVSFCPSRQGGFPTIEIVMKRQENYSDL